MLNEEIFGPIAAVQTFTREKDAVILANSTNQGLAGYVYTSDLGRAMQVAESLEVGMVGINQPRVSFAETPFGGVKQSGYGRSGGTAHSALTFQVSFSDTDDRALFVGASGR